MRPSNRTRIGRPQRNRQRRRRANRMPPLGSLLLKPPPSPRVKLPKTGPLDTFDKMMTLAQGILGVNQPDPEEFQTQEDFKQADRWHGIGELAGLAPALAMPLVGVMKGLKAGATVAADAHELQQPMRAYHGTRS